MKKSRFTETQIVGASWEGFVIEKGRHRLGIEIKFSMSPKVSRGFWQALKDIQASAAYIIAPVPMQYSYKENVQVMAVQDFIRDEVPLL